MDTLKVTAVANTAALLIAFDPLIGYKFRVQNLLDEDIWLSKDADPDLGSPGICVPKASDHGPGEYLTPEPNYDTWYYKTAGAGDFTVIYWPPS